MGLGLFISRSISTPMAKLADTARQISLGDVNQDIDYHSADEVGSLADSFRSLVAYIRGVSESLEKVAAGDMTSKLDTKSDRDVLTKSYQRTVTAVNALVADTCMLSNAAVEGKLATRADISKHQGDFRKITQGVNETLDAVIGPLNVAAKYVDQISKGDIPPQITDPYNGEFNTIKTNLNTLIVSMNDITKAAEQIADGDLTVTLRERSHTDGRQYSIDCWRSIGGEPIYQLRIHPGIERRKFTGCGGRRGFVFDGADGFEYQAECRQRPADRQDCEQICGRCATER
jgi:methyl-accepting chemotaxis protein